MREQLMFRKFLLETVSRQPGYSHTGESELNTAVFTFGEREDSFVPGANCSVRFRGRRCGQGETRVWMTVRIPFSMFCGRCGTRAVSELCVENDVIYRGGSSDVESGTGVVLVDEDEYPLKQFDWIEDLRQRIELAVPLKFLCSADCRGLCPVCGTDRNREDCGHDVGGQGVLGPLLRNWSKERNL